MIKVNSKNCISRLTTGMMKANKLRNIVAVVAIALTTFMLCSVFSIGLTIANTYDEQLQQYVGSTAHAYLSLPTDEQAKIVADKDYVEELGEGYTAAVSSIGDKFIVLLSGDDNYYKYVTPAMIGLKGQIPEKENEIVLSNGALEILGIDKAKEGMEIKFPYRTDIMDEDAGQTEGTFVLSGWYNDAFIRNKNTGIAYTSKAFFESTGNTAATTGSLQIIFDDETRTEEYLKELAEELNLSDKQRVKAYREFGFNSEKLMTGVGVAVIVFFVILCGYLLIYNVFFLSVTKDIRFYGLLKTIGTSPRQLRKIVGKQAVKLALYGIPAGLAAAGILLAIVKRAAVDQFGSGIYLLHPLGFGFAVLFTALTVYISVRKSSKKASKISPVEAVRFSGGEVTRKKGKKSTSGGKLSRMAYRNVFRDRKRAVIVMVSLFIGLTLFSVVLTIVNALNVENMAAAQFQADIEIGARYIDIEQGFDMDESLSEETISQIAGIPGVKEYYVTTDAVYELEFGEEYRPYLEYLQNDLSGYQEEDLADNFFGSIAGISRETLEEHYPEAARNIDLDAFERGEIVFSREVYDEYYALPDTMDLKSRMNGTTYTVQRKSLDTNLSGKSSGEAFALIGSQQLIEKMGGSPVASSMYMNVEDGQDAQVIAQIGDIIESSDTIYFDTKHDFREIMESVSVLMKVVGAAFTFILAFVGIINYINIMMTSVQSRKKELSVLESIGMTGAQMKKMLISEGLYYGGISLALVWTVGTALSYLIFVLFKSTADYAVFEYPLLGMISLSLFIAVICVAAPILNYRSLRKRV